MRRHINHRRESALRTLIQGLGFLALAGAAAFPALSARAQELPEGWRRIESRSCTLLLDPDVKPDELAHQLKTRAINHLVDLPDNPTPEEKLAARCDAIFARTQELLDLERPGLRVTVHIARDQAQIQDIHAERYGFRAKNIAYYVSESQTIYAATDQLTASVLAHEMAHCLLEEALTPRLPRKIEELLAQHVDTKF